MYHSKHNQNITYFFTWGKPVLIEGNCAICKEDTDIGKENWTKEYTRLYFKDGITEVKKGFLESFVMLRELVIDSTVKNIEMTEELRKLLKKNCVIIRGCYGTYAEEFAQENGLTFIHKDIYLGIRRNEEHSESRTITLHFDESGQMSLLYEDFCQGISAGNTMGGEFTRDLPEQFHKDCSLEEFADMMPGAYFEQIMKNKELEAFLDIYANRQK